VDERASWTFLSDHALVLLAIAAEPSMRIRDLAAEMGIDEAILQRVVDDLMVGGYVTCRRVGRRLFYRVDGEAHVNHPSGQRRQLWELIQLLAPHPEGRGLPG
jgi:MarR family